MAREDVMRSWQGDLFRVARVSRGLSRDQLRKNFPKKMSLSMIGHVETGIRGVRFEDLPDWARALSGDGSSTPISEAALRRMYLMTTGYVDLALERHFKAPRDPTGGEKQRQYWDLRWRDFNPASMYEHAKDLLVYQNEELDENAWMKSGDWDSAPTTWSNSKDDLAPQWLIQLLREENLHSVIREMTPGTSNVKTSLRGTRYQHDMFQRALDENYDFQPHPSVHVTNEENNEIDVLLPDVSTGRVKRGTHIPGYDDEVAWDLLHLTEAEKAKVREFVRELIDRRPRKKPE